MRLVMHLQNGIVLFIVLILVAIFTVALTSQRTVRVRRSFAFPLAIYPQSFHVRHGHILVLMLLPIFGDRG